MAIKDKIRKIRLLRKFTQVNIEEKTDINNRLIQMYESGKKTPQDKNLQKIADALNVDIWALKDIDFDSSNNESVRQLVFLLEEKGLFSLDDLTVNVDYIDEKPTYSIEVPISESWAEMFMTWKHLKTGAHSEDGDNDLLDKWKYNIVTAAKISNPDERPGYDKRNTYPSNKTI